MKFERWLDFVPRFTIRKSGQMCHDSRNFTKGLDTGFDSIFVLGLEPRRSIAGSQHHDLHLHSLA